MPLFNAFGAKAPYDKADDARTTATAALSTFEGIITDLEYSAQLLAEVEAEETAKANAANEAAQAALRDREYHTTVASRIRNLLGDVETVATDVG